MMRDDINKAVDTGILRNKQMTEWRKILIAILQEFSDRPDSYMIVIQGEDSPANDSGFTTQMRLSLGKLREMK